MDIRAAEKEHSPVTIVDIRPLKEFAERTLPKEWPLRIVLTAMEDHVLASEFVAHVKVWLVLLRREGGQT